jgi:hypothetical protein
MLFKMRASHGFSVSSLSSYSYGMTSFLYRKLL